MIDPPAPLREATWLSLAGHRLIVRCADADAASVNACVAFAGERKLPLALRGGGGNVDVVTSFVLPLHPAQRERLRNAGACILDPMKERSTP